MILWRRIEDDKDKSWNFVKRIKPFSTAWQRNRQQQQEQQPPADENVVSDMNQQLLEDVNEDMD